MNVVLGNELQFVDSPGGNSGSSLATTSRGATEVSVIRQRQQPGGTNPAHTHDREEVMILLAGNVTVAATGEPVAIGPGDTVIIPPNTPHLIENAESQPAEWLIVAPAGVRFFHASGVEANPPWAQ